MSDAELWEKLTQALANKGNEGVFDGFEKRDNIEADDKSLSDGVFDEKSGDILIKRTICSTDESGKVVEIVIEYNGGVPAKKIRKENGNTVSTTKFSKKVDKKGNIYTVATTLKADLSTEELTLNNIDENAEYAALIANEVENKTKINLS